MSHLDQETAAAQVQAIVYRSPRLYELPQSRIRLLPLPPYAPRSNPIEKVWRKVNQEVAHMHPFSSNWKGLRQTVDTWFGQWREGSQDLLQYVGLAQGYNPRKAVSPYP